MEKGDRLWGGGDRRIMIKENMLMLLPTTTLMTESIHTSTFQQAIESVDSWSLAEQKLLLDLLQKRIQQQQNHQLLQEVAAVRQEVAEGKVRYGSVSEFLSELDN